MSLEIKYFASLRETLHCEQESLDDADIKIIADVKKVLFEKYPQASNDIKDALCAVNFEYVDDNKVLQQNDEIAFFPPVTGG